MAGYGFGLPKTLEVRHVFVLVGTFDFPVSSSLPQRSRRIVRLHQN